MDRSLDEILAEKRSNSSSRNNSRRGSRPRRDRSEIFPRDGVRKSYRDSEPRNLDKDWVHDRFEDTAARRSITRPRRESPESYNDTRGAKIRVDNIHYDLSEADLDELFNRIGRVVKLELRYDRAGRSEGTAFVVYESRDDAREAIKEFDGANAKGQPIRLTLLPSGQSTRPQRNPFDTAVMPGRPLEERISHPGHASTDRDIDEAAKKGIDRYVPGASRRSRSPLNTIPPRRREGGRRPGTRHDGGGQGSRGSNDGEGGGGRGRRGGSHRPRKTAEELDAEMADYFAGPKADDAPAPAALAPGASGQHQEDDVEMIE